MKTRCARARGSRTIAAWSTSSRTASSRTSGCRTRRSPGYTSFTRYFYAQQDKDGAVIDERYNHGGMVADYIVNELDRKPMGYFAMRDGKTVDVADRGHLWPEGDDHQRVGRLGRRRASVHVSSCARSGRWSARARGAGSSARSAIPPTIDGGGITAPSLAFYDLKGEWAVENEGVAPDIEVEYTAAEVMKGHDPQLERAVQEALKLLEQNPVRRVPRPAPIDRVSKGRER